MNLGRHELLQWVNEIVQGQYPSIESLADGIGYCQILQAIHPGSININKMNFITKLPIDCIKNLKILENALKNMKINITVSIQKMGNGRFQDNIIFLKWLYAHAQKYGKQNLYNYNGYERRLQILERQGKKWDQVNIHLLPNQFYELHEYQQEQGHYYEQDRNRVMERGDEVGPEDGIDLQQKVDEITNYVVALQTELKQKMQLNWRTMHMIGRSIDERNTLYNLLQQIQKIAINCNQSPVQKQIMRILYEKPQDFKFNGK